MLALILAIELLRTKVPPTLLQLQSLAKGQDNPSDSLTNIHLKLSLDNLYLLSFVYPRMRGLLG